MYKFLFESLKVNKRKPGTEKNLEHCWTNFFFFNTVRKLWSRDGSKMMRLIASENEKKSINRIIETSHLRVKFFVAGIKGCPEKSFSLQNASFRLNRDWNWKDAKVLKTFYLFWWNLLFETFFEPWTFWSRNAGHPKEFWIIFPRFLKRSNLSVQT